jgi:hypothetical protein
VLEYPLVNREQALYEVLRNFRDASLSRAAGRDTARPTASFQPQLYGSGKSVFGEDFRHFLYASKDYLSQRIGRMPGVPPGPNIKERSVDALISGILYAFVDLRRFPEEGSRFRAELVTTISEKALLQFEDSSELLVQVLSFIIKPDKWISKLLEVTNKL